VSFIPKFTYCTSEEQCASSVAGVCWAIIVIYLPETYGPVLLAKRARGLRKQDPEKYANKYGAAERLDSSPKALLERTVFRPFIMLALEWVAHTTSKP
jgi:MFS transporter, DHA1 family, multidrug resistance protein